LSADNKRGKHLACFNTPSTGKLMKYQQHFLSATVEIWWGLFFSR